MRAVTIRDICESVFTDYVTQPKSRMQSRIPLHTRQPSTKKPLSLKKYIYITIYIYCIHLQKSIAKRDMQHTPNISKGHKRKKCLIAVRDGHCQPQENKTLENADRRELQPTSDGLQPSSDGLHPSKVS